MVRSFNDPSNARAPAGAIRIRPAPSTARTLFIAFLHPLFDAIPRASGGTIAGRAPLGTRRTPPGGRGRSDPPPRHARSARRPRQRDVAAHVVALGVAAGRDVD